MPPQFVKIANADVRPFDFHHRNIKRIVKPGADTIVPWDLAVTLLGDPFLVDEPRNPARTLGLKHARSVWGYMDGMETMEEFDARRLHLEVWDIETSPNQRIHMLVEDPDGMMTGDYAPDNGEQDQMSMLMQRMAVMQQMIDRLINTQSAPQLPNTQTVIPSNDAGPQPLPLTPLDIAAQQEHARTMAQFAAAGITAPDDTAAPIQVVETHGVSTEQALALAAEQQMTPQQKADAAALAIAKGAEQAAQTLAALRAQEATDSTIGAAPPATVDGPSPARMAPRPARQAS